MLSVEATPTRLHARAEKSPASSPCLPASYFHIFPRDGAPSRFRPSASRTRTRKNVCMCVCVSVYSPFSRQRFPGASARPWSKIGASERSHFFYLLIFIHGCLKPSSLPSVSLHGRLFPSFILLSPCPFALPRLALPRSSTPPATPPRRPRRVLPPRLG